MSSTPFRILIATSPCFADIDRLTQVCDSLLRNRPEVEICRVTMKGCIVAQYRKDAKHKVFVRDFNSWGKEATVYAYRDAVMYADAAVIFWNEESWNEKKLIELCMNKPMRYEVRTYKSVKKEIEEATEAEKKVKRKKITVALSPDSKRRYIEAHANWYQKQYPSTCKDGLYTPPKLFPINSGAAMDKFIVNFIVWSGWSATKVSVLQKRGKEYVRTGAKPGTFDLTATIKGRSVKIETKHGSDKPSEDQLKMQERERRSGAVAEFVYSIEEFFILYDKIVNGGL